MVTGLLTALAFVKDNLKWIVIALAIIASGYTANKLYNIISDNASYKVQAELQQEALKNKDDVIQLLQNDKVIAEFTVKARDEQIEALEMRIDGLTDNLGEGENDEAHPSLKELFRRLGKGN